MLKMPQPTITHEDQGATADHSPAYDVTDVKHVGEKERASSPIISEGGAIVGHGTFADGSGVVTGPPKEGIEPTLHNRAATAETVLSPVEKAALFKGEAKDAKRLSKIIKNEGKAEDRLLKSAIKDLDRMQKVQKGAASDEASAQAAHSKAVRLEQKLNKTYLAAKAKYEIAAADLKSKAERLESVREHAQTQTSLLQQKSQEVEQLRQQKATDDRERLAKLAALKNPALTV